MHERPEEDVDDEDIGEDLQRVQKRVHEVTLYGAVVLVVVPAAGAVHLFPFGKFAQRFAAEEGVAGVARRQRHEKQDAHKGHDGERLCPPPARKQQDDGLV